MKRAEPFLPDCLNATLESKDRNSTAEVIS